MDVVTYTAALTNLAITMDKVCNDHEPVVIVRDGEQSVVMISFEDFKSLEETSYLLQSPKNAKRLLNAIADLEQGKGIERELADEIRPLA